MGIEALLKGEIVKACNELYNLDIDENSLLLTYTRKEIKGDFTLVVFPLSKAARKGPALIAEEIGAFLSKRNDFIESYNVVKGFLNFSLSIAFWLSFLSDALAEKSFGHKASNGKRMLIEFSSPNTNKPLHLGHIRNILLGWSCSKIFEALGFEVIKTQVINDRGIHICKSMVAWQRFANGASPDSTGIKGDKFVGDYYVAYNKLEKEQKKEIEEGEEPEVLSAAREMLLKWEEKDEEVRRLWKQMNKWVLDGFAQTYQRIGVTFDAENFESQTYLLGKKHIEEGLKKGIFYQKEDGSVWIDLSDAGLDEKLVLRSDGTAIYITQDIGTAEMRFKEYGTSKMVYVVGNEQNYHFKALFEILKRLNAPYAGGLFHLSYGMVDLPSGKMKSREGTVVDADDLIDEVIGEAAANTIERGEIEGYSKDEVHALNTTIGLAALKILHY